MMILVTQSINNNRVKYNIDRFIWVKTILYISFLIISLFISNFIFGWKSPEEIPSFLQPFSMVILWINPYLVYIQATLIIIFGYISLNSVSKLIYMHFIKIADHPTAAAIRSIFRISGMAVLLSIIASIFNVNPTAALTVGSFGGLVVGFATQTILSNVVAGVFLLITRPFIYGDLIKVSGQTGRVKEIKLMHLVLESEDGINDILIPSGSIVTQIIQKRKTTDKQRHLQTDLILDPLPSIVMDGSKIEFTGKIVERDTGDPVSDVNIRIYENDVVVDDLIAFGKTGDNGRFNIEWKARKVELIGRTVELYAKFEGNADYRKSRSNQYKMKLKKK
jgi:hypothetical protein